MADKKHRLPPVRGATDRQRIADLLRRGPLSVREISMGAGVPERQVPEHLDHLHKSLKATGERLRVKPACCRDCGFEFAKRERLARPGRCPVCKGERIAEAIFDIV